MTDKSKRLMENVVDKTKEFFIENPNIDPILKQNITSRVHSDFTMAKLEPFNDYDLVEDKLSNLIDDFPMLEQKLFEVKLEQ